MELYDVSRWSTLGATHADTFYPDSPMRDIRRNALQKIAILSARADSGSPEGTNLGRLCKLCPTSPSRQLHAHNGFPSASTPISRVPMVCAVL